MKSISKLFFLLLSGASMSAMFAFACIAASIFQGTWKVTDTSGKPFEINLSADGTAKATLPKEGMTGTWKTDGDIAIINWDTGWITRIEKNGDKFTKSAFKKGETKPINSTNAEKIR
jgi:hypothetical protein